MANIVMNILEDMKKNEGASANAGAPNVVMSILQDLRDNPLPQPTNIVEEAERLVRQEEIVRQAEMLSKDIKTSAQRYEDEVKQGADAYADQVKNDSLQYADDMLGYLGNSLQSALRAIEDNRSSVNEERKSLAEVIASRVQHAVPQVEAPEVPAAEEAPEEEPEE